MASNMTVRFSGKLQSDPIDFYDPIGSESNPIDCH